VSVLLHLALLLGSIPQTSPPTPADRAVIPGKFVKRALRARLAPVRRQRQAPGVRPLVRSRGAVTTTQPAAVSLGRSSREGQWGAPGALSLSAAELPLPSVDWAAGPLRGTWRGGGEGVVVERVAGRSVDLGSELLGVESLDVGRYRSTVVLNPSDPRGVRGHLRLSAAYSEGVERAEAERGGLRTQAATSSQVPSVTRQEQEQSMLRGLADDLSERTGLRADVLNGLRLDDPALQSVPIVLFTVTAESFTLSEAELRNLGQYLSGGGFLYAEVVCDPRWVGTSYEYDRPALRRAIRDALRAVGKREGRDWRFTVLAQEHPIYHCFYSFAAPPQGYWRSSYFPQPGRPWAEYPAPPLEGIEMGGDLVGGYSHRGNSLYWRPGWGRGGHDGRPLAGTSGRG